MAIGLPILSSDVKFGLIDADENANNAGIQNLRSTRFAAAQEFYHGNGWTDGLPIVPPTEAAVQACLEWALMPPDQLIGIELVRAHAVMAGCLPMHFPVVVAAWQGMLKEEFLLHGVKSGLLHFHARSPMLCG